MKENANANLNNLTHTEFGKEEFCSLYAALKDKLYRYALYRLGNPDDAEDAVSECVMAAWKGISQLRSRDAFAAWMFGILRNCCASQIKKEIKKREIAAMLSESSENSVPQASASLSNPGSLSIELSEALNQLSDEAREIVLLSVIGGMSSKEIAEQTGLTAGSVRSKLSRSLARMRNYLD